MDIAVRIGWDTVAEKNVKMTVGPQLYQQATDKHIAEPYKIWNPFSLKL